MHFLDYLFIIDKISQVKSDSQDILLLQPFHQDNCKYNNNKYQSMDRSSSIRSSFIQQSLGYYKDHEELISQLKIFFSEQQCLLIGPYEIKTEDPQIRYVSTQIKLVNIQAEQHKLFGHLQSKYIFIDKQSEVAHVIMTKQLKFEENRDGCLIENVSIYGTVIDNKMVPYKKKEELIFPSEQEYHLKIRNSGLPMVIKKYECPLSNT